MKTRRGAFHGSCLWLASPPSLRSSSPQAASLHAELYALTKKKRSMIIDNLTYDLRARIFDSFGEDAFRMELRRV